MNANTHTREVYTLNAVIYVNIRTRVEKLICSFIQVEASSRYYPFGSNNNGMERAATQVVLALSSSSSPLKTMQKGNGSIAL